MKKNQFSLLLTLLMSMVSTTALAYHAEIDGIYYNFSRTVAQVTYKSAEENDAEALDRASSGMFERIKRK